jgi:hypothetical protein
MQTLDPNRTFPARNRFEQQVGVIAATVNFSDTGVATGIQIGTLPQGAYITSGSSVEVVTAFNAGTTNVFTVGTVLATANNIFAAADVTEATPGVYAIVLANQGRAAAAAGDVPIYVKYTQTGTAATTGQAVVVICYVTPVT